MTAVISKDAPVSNMGGRVDPKAFKNSCPVKYLIRKNLLMQNSSFSQFAGFSIETDLNDKGQRSHVYFV